MGFLDKLKSAAKFITGGGAKVSMEVIEPLLGGSFQVKVQATVADADLKIQKVYLHVRAAEQVTVPKVKVAEESQDEIIAKEQDVSTEVQTFQQEFLVSGAQTLSAKQVYNWETSIGLPSSLSPSYYGRNANHRYYFLAGLDAPGNDPDTGWIEVRI